VKTPPSLPAAVDILSPKPPDDPLSVDDVFFPDDDNDDGDDDDGEGDAVDDVDAVAEADPGDFVLPSFPVGCLGVVSG